MKALIYAFSIIASLLIVSTAAAAAATGEAGRDWIDLLTALGPAIAILGAAWWGFRGVRQTQIANAALARDQALEVQARERRRRQAEARTLARSLAAELRAGSEELLMNVALVKACGARGEDYTPGIARAISAPPIEIFKAQLNNIGRLGDLAADVARVYNHLRRVIRFDEDLQHSLEVSKLKTPAAEMKAEERWGQYATEATILADRLDAYDPPEDI